ncbi:MAG: TonB-dependent receptor [Bryobacterales bacterium]|nr:TonB-dependent receptor [Bryobacterales bacterium]
MHIFFTSSAIIFSLLFSPALFAQAGLGSLTGAVADSSGAVIPGAGVKLLEIATQGSRTVTSNEAGLFNFPSVVPGRYTITITSSGFKQKQLDNITVNAFQQIALGQITLEVGEGPSSIVTVTAEQQLVKESGVRYDTIQSKQVSEMPLNGRNWATLLKVIPGAVPTNTSAINGREYGFYGYADYKINGKATTQTQVNLDGGSIVDHGSDAKVTVSPSLESIQEISILTNNFQAEYGNRGGAVINIVTKGGTNQFHGVAFENLRNEALNANSWNNNYLGVKRAPYRYNYFGGNVSGPIKKNRLFFFYNFEKYKQFLPSSAALSRVPTAAERNGDFSRTLNANGSRPVIYQPGSQYSGTPVPMPGNIVPASQIMSLGKALMNVYPSPNFNGDPYYNYLFEYQSQQPRLSQVFRGDWNLDDATRLYVRYTNDSGTNVNRGTWNSGANFPWNMIQQERPDRALTIGGTRTFSPTLVVEGLFNWSYDYPNLTPVYPEQIDKTKLGLGSLPTVYQAKSNLLPDVVTGVYPEYHFNRLPSYALADEWQYSGTVTWTRGTHIFKFGMQHIRDYKDEVSNTIDKGLYNFGASPSQFDTNYGPSNMLVGALASFTQYETLNRKDSLYKDFHFFAQDSFRVRKNLTLDYGVRLYHIPAEYDRNPVALNDAVFLPSKWSASKAPRIYVPNPASPGSVIDPANPGNPLPSNLASALLYSVVPGSGDTLNGVYKLGEGGMGKAGMRDPRFLLVAPRGGFAWSPGGSQKTVIRGGFGWAYNRNNISQYINYFNNTMSGVANLIQTSLTTMASTSTVQRIAAKSYGVRDEASRKVPTVYDYSLSVQRELPFQFVLDVAYVGNLQRHQPLDFNLNALPLGTLFKQSSLDPRSSGVNYYGPVSVSNSGALPGSNALDPVALRPFQGLDTLTMTANVANLRHDSLQTTASKRFGGGLTMAVAYTYGRTLAQNENVGLYSYQWKDYAGYISGTDRRHVASINYTYDFPNFASHIRWDNAVSRRVLNGWQVAHMMTFFSGLPYSPTYSIQQANTSSVIDLNRITLGTPDLAPRLAVSSGAKGSGDQAHLFNVSALSPSLVYPQGDGTGLRNYLFAPGSWTNDISFVKIIRIHEDKALELRANLYNPFNTPRRMTVNSGVQYKAKGKTFADGFTVYNTPEALAQRLASTGVTNPQSLFNLYRTGAGHINLTDVQPMRIIEIGLKFRF